MKTEKRRWFFVDAETDGLYGPFLSVAVLVTDETGVEQDRFYGAVQVEREELRSPWVREHVFPYLSRAEQFFKNEQSLLESFWQFWMQYREQVFCVADVSSPVESRLFTTCVLQNLPGREFLAPFPLYDLSTLLIARGIPWNANRQELSGLDLTSHDAMDDVRMMAAIWCRLTLQTVEGTG